MTLYVPVNITPLSVNATMPTYANEGDAGLDLYSCLDLEGYMVIEPGQRRLVPTGVAFELPFGYVGLVHPRSGLAAKHGVTVLNAPGTLDAGYRGEVLVNLINHGPLDFYIYNGDRIAQLVLQEVKFAELNVVDKLSESERGTGGHGSTGR